IPIVAGSYVYGAWRDNAKAREIGVLGTESLLDSLIVVEILKAAARRNRPDEKNPGEFWGGGTSFPSGHSIQVWSIASLLAHEYKHKKIVGVTAYSLAGIVSASPLERTCPPPFDRGRRTKRPLPIQPARRCVSLGPTPFGGQMLQEGGYLLHSPSRYRLWF